jgi:hypothetical protein
MPSKQQLIYDHRLDSVLNALALFGLGHLGQAPSQDLSPKPQDLITKLNVDPDFANNLERGNELISKVFPDKFKVFCQRFGSLGLIAMQESKKPLTCEDLAKVRLELDQATLAMFLAVAELMMVTQKAADGVTICYLCPPLVPCWRPRGEESEGEARAMGSASTASESSYSSPTESDHGAKLE